MCKKEGFTVRRTIALAFLFCILIVLSITSWGEEQSQCPILAVINGSLIDGTGKLPTVNTVIIVHSGKISWVGKPSDAKIPDGATVIDAKGGYVLPGFINTHVHRGYDVENLKAWAYGGVTTVRDESMPGEAKSMLKLRDTELRRTELARIISAGPMMTKPGGYGQMFVSSADEAVARVNELIDAGVDLIKFSMEDGYAGTSGLPKFSENEVQAIVVAAHRRGVRVSAHITQGRYLETVVKSGVDDVAHIAYDYASDEIMREMVKRGIYWVPTFTVFRNFGAPLDLAVENLKIFVQSGGKVALGNDYAGGPGQFELGIPYFELAMMRRAGMTPMQIIIASTRGAAEVCGREKILGTVEVGKVGDFLIVQGNPLDNLNALKEIRWVIKDGCVIRRP